MSPRNPRAVAASQAVRADIRALLACRTQLQPPLSAKTVKRLLRLTISERAVRWHLAAIRLEAELLELACHGGNSSVGDGPIACR